MLVKIADKCGAEYVTTKRKEWSATPAQKKEVTKNAKELYLTIIFILNESKSNFSKNRDDCSNSYQACNQNLYPKTLEVAHEVLKKFKYDPIVYNQQSTSMSSKTMASSSDLYDAHQTLIQNEGSNNIEEANSTSDEEEEEDSLYAQSLKDTERD